MSQVALEIEGLSYEYRKDWGAGRVRALTGLTLTISRGEAFGFLGHNGAGKTTAIKCILSLIKPSSGSVRIFGRSNQDPVARAVVGYLPEQPYFYDHLTVRELLTLYATLAGLPGRELTKRVEAALDRVKLLPKIEARMRSLSKGLTQRVAMAQAIVAEPQLLILDEPFSGLDPIGRKEFRDLLHDLKRSGTTIFMSSHILGDVEFLCNRASILANGELRGVFDLRNELAFQKGTYELVLRAGPDLTETIGALLQKVERQDRFVRCTFTERSAAEDALKAALTAGIPVESFQHVHGTLEEIFMKLVKFEEAGVKA